MAIPSHYRAALDVMGKVNFFLLFCALLGFICGVNWEPNPMKLVLNPSCVAPPSMQADMISYYYYSFICSIFSALIAMGIQLQTARPRQKLSPIAIRVGYLLSAAASVSGGISFMLALINRSQIELGILGCGGYSRNRAVLGPLILGPPALAFYMFALFYVFLHY